MNRLTLSIRPEAEEDISHQHAWYERVSPGLGGRFLDELSRDFDDIAQRPASFPQVHRNARRARLHRFPFLVLFSVDGQHAVVHAVFHGAIGPKRLAAILRRRRTR